MKIEQTQDFCACCSRPTLFARPGVNHLVHAIVSLFLCGAWIPVWVLACVIGREPFRCQSCGSVMGQTFSPGISAEGGSSSGQIELHQWSDRSLLAYRLLGVFLGPIGVHNFYIGRWQIGIIQVLVFVIGIAYLNSTEGQASAPAVCAVIWVWVLLEIAGVRKDGKGRILK